VLNYKQSSGYFSAYAEEGGVMTILTKLGIYWLGGLLLLSAPLQAAEIPEYLSLYREGRSLEQAGQVAQALDLYEQAATRSRQENPEDAAKILHWMGRVYQQQRVFDKAENALREALQLREQHLGASHEAVAVSADALAGLYFELGRYPDAEDLYRRALSIDEQILGASHWKVALRLNNLAELKRTLGNYDQAEKLLLRALEIDKQQWGEEHSNVAVRLSNLAEVYRYQGAYPKAKTLLEQALAMDEKLYQANELSALNLGIRYNNLGQLYLTLGDIAKARPYYEKALELWRQDPGENSPVSAAGLNNLGWLAYLDKNYRQATELYDRALAIVRQAYGAQHPDIARNLNNLGLLYAAQKDIDNAERAYTEALVQWRVLYGEDHPNTLKTANNLAKLYRESQRQSQAEDLLKQTLVRTRRIENPALLWQVYDNLARLLGQNGDTGAAILMAKQAVNTLQDLRLSLAGMDKELQHSFMHDKQGAYQYLADLLMGHGRLGEGQEVLMMLKEEAYFDFITRSADHDERVLRAAYSDDERAWVERALLVDSLPLVLAQADPSPLRQDDDSANALIAFNKYFEALKEAFREAQADATAAQVAATVEDRELAAQALEYRGLRGRTDLSAAEDQRRLELRQVLFNASKSFNACLGELQTFAKFQGQNLDTLRALQHTLLEMGHQAVLLNYLITPQRLRIILTTPDIQLCRESEISAAELDEAIQKFRTALQNRRNYPAREARNLYRVLIEPVAEDLRQAQAKTLMLALDGRLRYIPMAALYDGEKYLAENYALAMFTEAARDKLKDAPTPNWRMAGLGLTEAVAGFNPLPAVEQELKSLVRVNADDSQGVMPGIIKLNHDFNANSLLDILEQGYPVIHIASHFIFQPRTELDSYLLLGDGAALDLAKIRIGYNFNGVDLLTLSACQTAVGSIGEGDEVEGFGALAQKQGAKSVLATLWPVDDRSTGLFMKHLYRAHEEQAGLTKAQALQNAQQAFIAARRTAVAVERGELSVDKAQVLYQRDYDHPFYWAPFILMGNWL
jgi:CHAT domain-containing protein/tetratricopeptide (TPR) repeat protein